MKHSLGIVTLIGLAQLVPVLASSSQPPKKKPRATSTSVASGATEPRFKGIWEPVNYPADLYLDDVFFVSPDVGWVSGGVSGKGGGVILHTKDGGRNWTVQLGDPESSEGAFGYLRFIDATHGWAVQRTGGPLKLLRTTDGENWEAIGSIAGHTGDIAFPSRSTGFYIYGSEIHRTTDGGENWEKVLDCGTKADVAGLTRDISCHLRSIDFPSERVGYAVGDCSDVSKAFCLAKTDDGGESWTVSVVPATHRAEEVEFPTETTGFVRLYGSKLYATSDGGKTWKGLPLSAPGAAEVKFADPEVGWSIAYRNILYTTDGGKRWTSRPLSFPEFPNAFALPSRNRGYVVGPHGMIYRYRVVPITETNSKAIPGPVMPAAKP